MAMRIGIITISDRSSRGERPDTSGPALAQIFTQQAWQVARTTIIPDEFELIVATLTEWSDSNEIDVIFTTGGTGFSPRDITPEATLAVIHRSALGLTEAMRSAGMRITPFAMLSRAVAGIRGRTLIINLPGNPKGAVENLEVLLPALPHAIQLLRGDPTAEAGHRQGD
ncbi:MAG: MogA/MoaB family molybdenum cofactor biosynthesis protein [Acidobacteriaceae bacterium]